jgi:hypothetical protein
MEWKVRAPLLDADLEQGLLQRNLLNPGQSCQFSVLVQHPREDCIHCKADLPMA